MRDPRRSILARRIYRRLGVDRRVSPSYALRSARVLRFLRVPRDPRASKYSGLSRRVPMASPCADTRRDERQEDEAGPRKHTLRSLKPCNDCRRYFELAYVLFIRRFVRFSAFMVFRSRSVHSRFGGIHRRTGHASRSHPKRDIISLASRSRTVA